MKKNNIQLIKFKNDLNKFKNEKFKARNYI